jgi:hypothetical protein
MHRDQRRLLAAIGPTSHARLTLSPPTLFLCLGGTMVVAGGLVAAVDSAAPFAHGSWLAALLWNLGGSAIPAGVLVTEPLLIAIAALAISVLVGCTLGDAAPAAWLQ